MRATGGTHGRVSGDGDANAQFSAEVVFEILGSRRRRYTLHYLRMQDRPVPIRELSEQLSAWEVGKECTAVTPKERKRLYTALHQTHLPKMDRLGVVEHDRNRGIVSLTDNISQFDIYLDIVPRDDLPWSQFYLALGAVLTALVSVAALGIAPFSTVGGFSYALVVASLFTLVAAYHMTRDRQLSLGSPAAPPDARVPLTDDDVLEPKK